MELTIRLTTWKDCAEQVKRVNPELYNIIANIDPNDSFRLYVGEYPYGCHILKRGKFHIPIRGHGMVPINHPSVPKRIRSDLSYNVETNPVSLVLQNSFEIYLGQWDAPSPLMLVEEGALFSISRVVVSNPHHPAFIWNISAGARSLFMLAKISQVRKYQRLCKEFCINATPPQNNSEHWHIFKKLIHANASNQWNAQLLHFSKKWFEYLDDPAWIDFKVYLLERFAKAFDSIGNQYMWDLVFSYFLKRNKIRPSLYTTNMVKHLFEVGIGIVPGSANATDNTKAPITFLKTIFNSIYNLNYEPDIITPTYFNLYDKSSIVYASINSSSLIDTPNKRDNSSLLSDLYDCTWLLNKYIKDLQGGDYNINNTPFHDFVSSISVRGFHPQGDKYSNLYTTENIIDNDSSFSNQHRKKPTAINSQFFKGCFQFKH